MFINVQSVASKPWEETGLAFIQLVKWDHKNCRDEDKSRCKHLVNIKRRSG